MKNKEILRKLRSVELCMTAHPDCEKGSEFEDRIYDLQELQKALILPTVSNQRELLIDLLDKLEKGGDNRFVSKEWIVDNYLQGN